MQTKVETLGKKHYVGALLIADGIEMRAGYVDPSVNASCGRRGKEGGQIVARIAKLAAVVGKLQRGELERGINGKHRGDNGIAAAPAS